MSAPWITRHRRRLPPRQNRRHLLPGHLCTLGTGGFSSCWHGQQFLPLLAGIVTFSQGYPHWGAGLVFVSLLGMTAVTLHLLEKRPKALPRPGPIVVGVATVTWAFVGCMA